MASLFKAAAPEFLQMIVVHELAHLKESEHNKAFYQLCQHMLPDYQQREFDLRLYLTWRELPATDQCPSAVHPERSAAESKDSHDTAPVDSTLPDLRSR